MIEFTVGDTVVYNGAPHLVRSQEGLVFTVMDIWGEYHRITSDDVTSVYID